jgi:hypothetical protein
MIKTKTLVLSTILLLSPLPTFAADTWQKLEFPTAIKTTQTITAKPSGWEASIGENEHQVVGVTVYDGHPDQQASLVPNIKTNKKDLQTTASWQFSANSEIWMGVSFTNTAAVLYKKLPEKITELRVKYDEKGFIQGLPIIMNIDYR